MRPNGWIRLVVLLTATTVANLRVAGDNGRGNGMNGPDYALGQIDDWNAPDHGIARLQLADGSIWTIATTDPHFTTVRADIEVARQRKTPIFISGDRRTGRIDQVTLPRRLRPMRIESDARDGKLGVLFHGPPSVYHLRADRPWFIEARDLLERTIEQESRTAFPPELLVTIDGTTREIMDVRKPTSAQRIL